MKHRLAGTAVGLLFILALAPAVAQAGPATVTVRVVGQSHTLDRTTVTTTATPVVEDGHDCSGTSDGGALDLAVGHANWSAHYDTTYNAFLLDQIYGEAYPISASSTVQWSVYINGLQAANGTCGNELAGGDDVAFYYACSPYNPPPAGTPCYGEPLELSGVPATITPGKPFQVTVNESTTDFMGTYQTTISPSAGATVTVGSASATTDAQGRATLTASDHGPLTVKATKGNRLYDTRPTCSTDGADGFCGTTKAGTPVVTAPAPAAIDRTPPGSLLTGLTAGRTYAKGKGPRELRGSVSDASGILMVKLRITRTRGDRCWYFSGRKLRFVGMRCGAKHGSWFKIGSSPEWRYLLPERLPPGRYVVDVNAIDKQYNRDDARRRGGNRVVFEVS
jgi:hypothetical protein